MATQWQSSTISVKILCVDICCACAAAFHPDADDNDAVDAEVRGHTRGMGTFVFVPWSQVNTSVLNKGIDEMDVWVPG